MAKNRSELVAEVAEKSGLTHKQVSDVLDGVFESFTEAVSAGDKLTIPGWLSVERTERAARKGRNPQTGAEIEIPAGYSVKLSAGSKLKAAASNKRASARERLTRTEAAGSPRGAGRFVVPAPGAVPASRRRPASSVRRPAGASALGRWLR